ncbi:MAG: hypothetical protein WD335_02845 [Candidatus Paceibacterota bacterium]
MLNKDQVISIIKDLHFPPDQYLVIAGTVMAVHGIRKADDVDLVISSDLFEHLKEEGDWEHCTRHEDNSEFLARDKIDIASKLDLYDYPTTLTEAKIRQDIIEGIPFMGLNDLIEFKQVYGRKKDLGDIKLIKDYLQANKLLNHD